MKRLFVIGTVVVLGCSMWVSFHHTLELFRAGRFTKGLEWPATIAAETAFIMGLLSLFDARRKGTSPPWQAKMLFMLGLIVVGWSNVGAGVGYAWSGVWTAIILGVLIPIFIFGAEAVLTHAYFESAKRKRRAENSDEMGVGEVQSVAAQVSNSAQRETAHVGVGEVREESAQTSTPAQWEGLTAQLGATRADDLSQREETARAQVGAPEKEAGDARVNAAAQETKDSQVKPPAQENAAQLGAGDAQADNSARVGEIQDNPPAQNESSQKRGRAAQEEDIAFAIECARDYLRDQGKLPSRRKLAEIADCSEWIARKALQQLQKSA